MKPLSVSLGAILGIGLVATVAAAGNVPKGICLQDGVYPEVYWVLRIKPQGKTTLLNGKKAYYQVVGESSTFNGYAYPVAGAAYTTDDNADGTPETLRVEVTGTYAENMSSPVVTAGFEILYTLATGGAAISASFSPTGAANFGGFDPATSIDCSLFGKPDL